MANWLDNAGYSWDSAKNSAPTPSPTPNPTPKPFAPAASVSSSSAERARTKMREARFNTISALKQQNQPVGATLNDVILARAGLLGTPGAYETVGGTNQATIASLLSQKAQLEKLYQTNRADAQNLYGQLSTDIAQRGGQLQTAYDTQITNSQTAATASRAALSTELANQQAARQTVAKELGLAPESVQTGYESDTALNTAMGNVLANAGDWENLLRTNKTSAQERTDQLVTATGNTLTQTLLGMKQSLDAQSAQIDAAIQAEKSKTPTQRLTSLGKVLESVGNSLIKDFLQPQEQSLYSENPAIARKQQGFEYFGKNMSNSSDNNWYQQTLTKIVDKLNSGKITSNPLTAAEKEFMEVFGISTAGLNVPSLSAIQ